MMYTRVRHTRAATAAHPFEFEVSRCRTSQFARCFLPAQVQNLMWNDHPYTVFDTRMLDGFLSCLSFSFPERSCLLGCDSNL